MRYYVFPTRDGRWGIGISYGEGINNCRDNPYDVYDTEREAIEKCEKLNAMLYPQPYIFIER